MAFMDGPYGWQVCMATMDGPYVFFCGWPSWMALMDYFYGWAKRNNWELDRQKTASLIKNLSNFEKEVRMKIKQQTPHVIKIKSMKIESDEEPEISEVKYEESPF